MLKSLVRRLVAPLSDNRAVSAIEFAIIAPILVMLSLVGMDVGRYVYAAEQISRVANTVAQIITSKSAVGPTGLITIDDADLQSVHDSAQVVFPDILADSERQGVIWDSLIAINIASISFTAGPGGCTTNCTTYTPLVRWTGVSNPRACGASFTPMVDSHSPDPALLPDDMYPPAGANGPNNRTGNIIVVDIAYTYRPVLTGSEWNTGFFSVPTITIQRSVYMSPRYTPTEIIYVPGGTPMQVATNCP